MLITRKFFKLGTYRIIFIRCFSATYVCLILHVIRISTDHIFGSIFTCIDTYEFRTCIIFLQNSAVFQGILVFGGDVEVWIVAIVVGSTWLYVFSGFFSKCSFVLSYVVLLCNFAVLFCSFVVF